MFFLPTTCRKNWGYHTCQNQGFSFLGNGLRTWEGITRDVMPGYFQRPAVAAFGVGAVGQWQFHTASNCYSRFGQFWSGGLGFRWEDGCSGVPRPEWACDRESAWFLALKPRSHPQYKSWPLHVNSKSLDGSCCKKMLKKGWSNHQMDSNGIKWLCSPTSSWEMFGVSGFAVGFLESLWIQDACSWFRSWRRSRSDSRRWQTVRWYVIWAYLTSAVLWAYLTWRGDRASEPEPNSWDDHKEWVRPIATWNLIGFVVSSCSQISSELIITCCRTY